MKILVVLKQVPDSTTTIKVKDDNSGVDPGCIKKLVVNPFDEFAIETAAQLKEKRKDVEELVALTVGPASAADALKTALAVGCDKAIHLSDAAFDDLDELQTARLIAEIAKDRGFDLIVTGKQEIDLDSGQTGPALAELLGWPHVGAITNVTVADDGATLKANRRIEGAEELVDVTLPALITLEKGFVEMRYPSLPNMMKAKKKPMETLTAADVSGFDAAAGAGGSKRIKLEPPPPRPPGKKIEGEPEEQVKELVRLLREEAKAI